MAKAKRTIRRKSPYKEAAEYYKVEKGWRYSVKLKFLLFILTALFCSFFFSVHINPHSGNIMQFAAKPGYVWTSQPITAEFTFPVFREMDNYLNDVKKAKENSLPVFIYEASAQEQSLKQLNLIITALQNYILNPDDKINIYFTSDELKDFDGLSASVKSKELMLINRLLKSFVNDVYRFGFANITVNSLECNEVSLQLPPNYVKIYSSDLITDSTTINEKASKFLDDNITTASKELAIEILSKICIPNFIYSRSLTDQAISLAEKSVPHTDGIIRKGDVIVSKGQVVTNEVLQKLKSYERSKLLRSENIYSFWYFLGSFGHASIIYMVLLIYLYFIRKRIFYDNVQVLILNVLLILIASLSWLSIEITTTLPLEFFILLPALSMLSAIVFDSRTAFYVTVTMALMIAGIRGNDYDLGISMLFAGTLAAYTVRDIQSRTQIFKSIFYIFIALAISVVFIGLEHSAEISVTLNKLMISLVNAVFSPLVTFGLLFILERVSNITTDLRLQEYDNLNHPILLKLSEVAPGTYQHTASLAQLAERCATVINANPLLTKVGAYFHDIGKISKPEYFSENQIDIDDKHKLLSPRKSAEAIIEHVLDGIKLAHEFKIPQRIIDFIPMHHGTSIVKHFYALAVEQAHGEHVDDIYFRYPGPKPNSKETGILMICDSCEALSRLPYKTQDELEKNIEKSVKDKILDGQLNESHLTLNEIETIKDTCIKTLHGISHPRPEYKEIPEEKPINSAPEDDQGYNG